MREAIEAVIVGLPILWTAQALLSLRDYFTRRAEIRRMPPITPDEIAAIEKVKNAVPVKEKRSFGYYWRHPVKSVAAFLIYAPFVLVFWPMVSVWMILPKLDVRLSEAVMEKTKSRGSWL